MVVGGGCSCGGNSYSIIKHFEKRKWTIFVSNICVYSHMYMQISDTLRSIHFPSVYYLTLQDLIERFRMTKLSCTQNLVCSALFQPLVQTRTLVISLIYLLLGNIRVMNNPIYIKLVCLHIEVI